MPSDAEAAIEELRGQLIRSIEAAEESVLNGEGIPITAESVLQLAADIKRRGRERMAALSKVPVK